MKISKFILPVIVSIGLVFLLLKEADIKQIISLIIAFPILILCLTFFLYVLSNTARALRFGLLITKKIPFQSMFGIVCLHNLFNGLLPMRTGELSFVYMMSKRKEKKTSALGALLIARFFDLIAISFLFIISVFILGLDEKKFLIMSYLLAGAILVFCAVFIVLYKNISRLKGIIKNKIYSYVINKTEEVFSNIKKLNFRTTIKALSLSLLIWISNFYMGYLIALFIGINIGLLRIFLAFAFIAIASLIPIHGIAGFGTVEATWTIIFIFFGVEKSIAISSGFGFHLINILFYAVLGAIGFIVLRVFEKKV